MTEWLMGGRMHSFKKEHTDTKGSIWEQHHLRGKTKPQFATNVIMLALPGIILPTCKPLVKMEKYKFVFAGYFKST